MGLIAKKSIFVDEKDAYFDCQLRLFFVSRRKPIDKKSPIFDTQREVVCSNSIERWDVSLLQNWRKNGISWPSLLRLCGVLIFLRGNHWACLLGPIAPIVIFEQWSILVFAQWSYFVSFQPLSLEAFYERTGVISLVQKVKKSRKIHNETILGCVARTPSSKSENEWPSWLPIGTHTKIAQKIRLFPRKREKLHLTSHEIVC